MAGVIILDEPQHVPDEEVPENVEVADTAAPKDEAPSETPQEQPQKQEDDLPQKFRGKTAKDIAAAYEQLEKLVGRQGAELGELRKTHDEFIKAALAGRIKNDAPAEQKVDEETEFFVNPKEAVTKLVENHPLVRQLREQQERVTAEGARAALAQKHPDWKEVVTQPEFVEFVSSHPALGTLMQQAHVRYDVAAADFVLSQFKERQKTKAATTDAVRQSAVTAGSVPTGSGGQGDVSGKKVYSRAAIIRKMQTDPDWYAENAADILQAYEEGRVR